MSAHEQQVRDEYAHVDEHLESFEYWSDARWLVGGGTTRQIVGWNPVTRLFFLGTEYDEISGSGDTSINIWDWDGVTGATLGEVRAKATGSYSAPLGELGNYREYLASELRLLDDYGERILADRRKVLGLTADEERAGLLDVSRSEAGDLEYRIAPGPRGNERPFFGYGNAVWVGWNASSAEFFVRVAEPDDEPAESSWRGAVIATASAPTLGALDAKLREFAELPDEVRVRLERDSGRTPTSGVGQDQVRLEFAIARDGYERAARAWRNGEATFDTLMDAFGVYARTTGRLLESEGSLEALREALDAPRSRATAVLEAVDEYAAARALALNVEREVRRVGADERPRFVGHQEKEYFGRRAAVLDGWRSPNRVWTREDYNIFGEWSPERRDFAHALGYGLARDRVERARAALVEAVPVYGRSLVARLENGRPFERLSDEAVEGFSSYRDSDRARIAGHVAGVLRTIEEENREIAGQKAASGHDSPLSKALPKLILARQAVELAVELAGSPGGDTTFTTARDRSRSDNRGLGIA